MQASLLIIFLQKNRVSTCPGSNLNQHFPKSDPYDTSYYVNLTNIHTKNQILGSLENSNFYNWIGYLGITKMLINTVIDAVSFHKM